MFFLNIYSVRSFFASSRLFFCIHLRIQMSNFSVLILSFILQCSCYSRKTIRRFIWGIITSGHILWFFSFRWTFLLGFIEWILWLFIYFWLWLFFFLCRCSWKYMHDFLFNLFFKLSCNLPNWETLQNIFLNFLFSSFQYWVFLNIKYRQVTCQFVISYCQVNLKI